MNTVIAFATSLILLSVAGLFYLGAYNCFRNYCDRHKDWSWRIFHLFYVGLCLGAGTITIVIVVFLIGMSYD